jgi:hypothetical protein
MTSLYDLFSITMTKMWCTDGSGAPVNTDGDGGSPGVAKIDDAGRDASTQPTRIANTKLTDVSFTERIGMVVPRDLLGVDSIDGRDDAYRNDIGRDAYDPNERGGIIATGAPGGAVFSASTEVDAARSSH